LSLPVRAADQLTVARILAAPLIVVLFLADFNGHDYWATAVFVAAMATDWLDGRLARRGGYGTDLGSLLDPIADKILVLTALIMLVGEGVFAGWMVAIIVAREFLVTGLRYAALERGVVLRARDLGKLKTWGQSTAVVLGGLAAGGAIDQSIAWWALLAAVLLTLLSGLDYARVAPRVLRGRPA
jgi:CDP-diacylglycerol--glycerol-3-phosphate 3-phosphatidyltransferase